MTKYSCATNQDQTLVDNSLLWLSWLIFGKNSPSTETLKKLFALQVESISVYPQGTRTTKINNQTPGCSWIDDKNQIHIEMLGYKNSNNSQHKFIKHESVHEHAHAFADLLPYCLQNNQHQNGITQNGTLLQNRAGMIRTSNPRTGQLVGQHFYGKMSNETLMDIITSMAINSFDPNSRGGATADEILQIKYTHWGNAQTGYSIFTSLTRLAIAAFSNNGFISYQQLINSGIGILL